MEIEFDNHHNIANGDKTNLSPYCYSIPNHYKFSQLALCITGSPEFIKEKLQKIISEIESNGKPIQGQIIHKEGHLAEVITPVWNNIFDDGKKEEKELVKEVGTQEDIPQEDIPMVTGTIIRIS